MSADKPRYQSTVDLTATYKKYGVEAGQPLPARSLAEFGICCCDVPAPGAMAVKTGEVFEETTKPSNLGFACTFDMTATYKKYDVEPGQPLPAHSLAEFGISFSEGPPSWHGHCGLGPNAERSCYYN